MGMIWLLQTFRLIEWTALVVGRVKVAVSSKLPPIFGCVWSFYDVDPSNGGVPVGEAKLSQRWIRDSIRMEHTRRAERENGKEVVRPYEATGTLRGNRLVLLWESVGRPDIFGSLVLMLNTDFDEMTGKTVYYSPMDKDFREYPIWFKKARVR